MASRGKWERNVTIEELLFGWFKFYSENMSEGKYAITINGGPGEINRGIPSPFIEKDCYHSFLSHIFRDESDILENYVELIPNYYNLEIDPFDLAYTPTRNLKEELDYHYERYLRYSFRFILTEGTIFPSIPQP
jgi:hypothetical protein